MSFVNLNITIIHSTSQIRSPPSLPSLPCLSVSRDLHSFPSILFFLILRMLSSSSSSFLLLLPRILGNARLRFRFLHTIRGVARSFLFCFQRPSRMPRTALKFQISFNRNGSSVPDVSLANPTMQLGSC